MIEPKPAANDRDAELPFRTAWAERLRAVIADRRATIAGLDALADGGAIATLAGGDTARIRGLLAERQTLVDRLVAGQPEFLGLVADLERGLADLSPDDARTLRDGVADFAADLARVGEQSERAHAVVREACGGWHAASLGEAA